LDLKPKLKGEITVLDPFYKNTGHCISLQQKCNLTNFLCLNFYLYTIKKSLKDQAKYYKVCWATSIGSSMLALFYTAHPDFWSKLKYVLKGKLGGGCRSSYFGIWWILR